MANEFIIRKGFKSLQDSQITGSLIITGSTSTNPTIINPGGDGLAGKVFVVTGSAAISRDLIIGDDLTVEDETQLSRETTIGYNSSENNYDVSYQLNVTASSNSLYSANFDGGIIITGSSVFSGSLEVLGSISGDITGSASTASYIELSNVDGSASLASRISSNSSSIGSLNAVSSSYLLNTTDTLTGDLTVTGNIIATTLNVQDVTASVIYSSGSNIFGSSSIDTQQFTGSILTSGSIEVNGDKFTINGATGDTVVAGKVMLGSGTPVRKLELKTITGARNLGIGLNDKDGVEQATIAVDQNTNDLITATKSNMRFFTNSTIGSIATLPTNQALLLDTSLNATFAGNITFGDSHFIGDDGDDNLLIQSSAGENIVLDSSDDIVLDADGADVVFKDAGTSIGRFKNNSGNFVIKSEGSDDDIIFKGNDGGSEITALTLDMSAGGTATFEGDVGMAKLTATKSGTVAVFNSGTTNVVASFTSTDGTGVIQLVDSGGNVEIGAAGNDFVVQPAGGVAQLTVGSSSSTFAGSTLLNGLASDGYRIYKIKIQAPYTGGWGSITPGTVIGGLQQTNVRTDGGANNIAAAVDFELENNTYGTGETSISFKCGGVNGVDSTERMRIYSSGNVQIGASSVTNLSLGSNGSDIELSSKKDGTDPIDMVFKTQASGGTLAQRMRIDSAGSIIIGDGATSGTPTADYRSLEIGRQGNTITGAPWKSNLYFSTNATITAGSTAFTYRYASAAPTQMTMEGGIFTWSNAIAGTVGDQITFTERMRIDSSGSIYSSNSIQNTYFGQDAGNPANATGASNSSFGFQAGAALTTGNNNVIIGINAGLRVLNGTRNQLIGSHAGTFLTSGSFNVALGDQALFSQTTASANVAVGRNALYANVTGGNNTALGEQALTANTASNNTAVGLYASLNNTSGGGNVSMGVQALQTNQTGDSNTALGMQTLFSNTGGKNTAVGFEAGKSLNSDVENVFVGYHAGKLRTAGIDNVFIGASAGYSQGTGCCNVAIGRASGYSLTSGVQNTFLGRQAGYSVATANNNTIVGHNAGLNATGPQNTLIGSGAGDAITTGNHNNIFGYGCDASSVSGTDQIVIGTNGQTGKGNSTGFIAPGSGGVFQGNNATTWSNTSDERIKKNIVDNNKGLEIINKIQIRNFEYRTEDEITDFENPKSAVIKKKGIQLGVIAQEIEKILPETITEESTGVKTLNSDNLTWYLINAVKELKADNDSLKARIETLENN